MTLQVDDHAARSLLLLKLERQQKESALATPLFWAPPETRLMVLLLRKIPSGSDIEESMSIAMQVKQKSVSYRYCLHQKASVIYQVYIHNVIRVVKRFVSFHQETAFYALCDVGVHSSTATFGTDDTRLTLADEGYCGLNKTWSEVVPGFSRVMVKTVTPGLGWS